MHINIYFHNNIYVNYIYKIILKCNIFKTRPVIELEKLPVWSDRRTSDVLNIYFIYY